MRVFLINGNAIALNYFSSGYFFNNGTLNVSSFANYSTNPCTNGLNGSAVLNADSIYNNGDLVNMRLINTGALHNNSILTNLSFLAISNLCSA